MYFFIMKFLATVLLPLRYNKADQAITERVFFKSSFSTVHYSYKDHLESFSGNSSSRFTLHDQRVQQYILPQAVAQPTTAEKSVLQNLITVTI